MSIGQMLVGQMSVGQMSIDQMSVGQGVFDETAQNPKLDMLLIQQTNHSFVRLNPTKLFSVATDATENKLECLSCQASSLMSAERLAHFGTLQVALTQILDLAIRASKGKRSSLFVEASVM
jgi:hypothetical protein